jgi:hypothetical protein
MMGPLEAMQTPIAPLGAIKGKTPIKQGMPRTQISMQQPSMGAPQCKCNQSQSNNKPSTLRKLRLSLSWLFKPNLFKPSLFNRCLDLKKLMTQEEPRKTT